MGKNQPANFKMDHLISGVLRGGVLISLLFLTAGLLGRRLATGHFEFDYTLPHTNLLHFIRNTFQQVSEGKFRPRLFINLGIATLMLTPYFRVLASLLYFGLAEKNRKYTFFTALVLGILTYSLMIRG